MKSLQDVVKERVLDAVRSVQPTNKWKVVVVDRESSKLIENVMRLNDFLDENVTAVEAIEDIREGFTSFEAVYFLKARSESLKCIAKDFSRQPITYAAANLFFLNALSDELMDELKPISEHIKTLKELFVDFYPEESQLVTFRDTDSPLILYNPNLAPLVDSHVLELAKKIVCICAALGEYPVVRYHRPSEGSFAAKTLSAKLANTVQRELDNYARTNEGFPPKSERPRGVLLIMDRSLDLNTPLLHEFTFQAMANDLLPIRDGRRYKYQVDGTVGKEEKEEEISDKDPVWQSVRHVHMSTAIDKLVQDFNKFTQDNSDFGTDAKATSLNAIRNMMAGMDSYTQGKNKYSLYITMAQDCMNLFEKNQLPITGQIEQNCATGLNNDGKVPKLLLEELVPLLDDDRIPPADRLRLIMLYALYKRGMFTDDRLKLLRHAKIQSDIQDAVLNMDLLGLPPRVSDRPKKKAPRRSSEGTEDGFELSRYVPTLKTAVNDHIKGSLDPHLFPYTRDAPTVESLRNPQGSLRTNRPAWAKGRTMTNEPRQRVLVFMAGGATYSELRSCYELSDIYHRDIILSSSNMLTPDSWINTLADLRRQRSELGLLLDIPKPKIPLLEAKPATQPKLSASAPAPMQQRPVSALKSQEKNPATTLQSKNSISSMSSSKDKDRDGKKKKKFGLF